jgi:hypothetical protein
MKIKENEKKILISINHKLWNFGPGTSNAHHDEYFVSYCVSDSSYLPKKVDKDLEIKFSYQFYLETQANMPMLSLQFFRLTTHNAFAKAALIL